MFELSMVTPTKNMKKKKKITSHEASRPNNIPLNMIAPNHLFETNLQTRKVVQWLKFKTI